MGISGLWRIQRIPGRTKKELGLIEKLSIPAGAYALYRIARHRGWIGVTKTANGFNIDVNLTPETKKTIRQAVITLSVAAVAAAAINARR